MNQLLNAADVDEISRLANLAKAAITAGLGAQVTLGDIAATGYVAADANLGKRNEEVDTTALQYVLQANLNGLLEIIASPDPDMIHEQVQDPLNVL